MPTATLYRMKTEEHICPFGLKAKDLLEREGFEVDDRLLTSRAETDDFKARHHVDTTPQTFIEGERVGGYGVPDVGVPSRIEGIDASCLAEIFTGTPMNERRPRMSRALGLAE